VRKFEGPYMGYDPERCYPDPAKWLIAKGVWETGEWSIIAPYCVRAEITFPTGAEAFATFAEGVHPFE
jgi:hypothetical protein